MRLRTTFDTYQPGRDALAEYSGEILRWLPTRQPRSEVERVLRWHVVAVARRTMVVSQLLAPSTLAEAAILARTVVELGYSAAYIGFAPKTLRAHRVARFTAFESVQENFFIRWQESIGLRSAPEERAKAAADATEALRVFSRLEANLRVGWSGERVGALLRELEVPLPSFAEWLAPAYACFSFHVHPTPLGMRHSTVPRPRPYTWAIPYAVFLAGDLAALAFRMRARVKKKRRLGGEYAEDLIAALAAVPRASPDRTS
jgi:hypothetical protein